MLSVVWLGLDVGSRDLGVAVGNEITGRAQPLKVLAMEPGEQRWEALAQLVREWAPSGFVVGLPLSHDGGEQPMSIRARAFAEELGTRFCKPVALQDERGSTQVARRQFAASRANGSARRKQVGSIDALAAAVILEDYLATAGH